MSNCIPALRKSANLFSFLAAAILMAGMARGQTSANQYSVGVLPLTDNTGADGGQALATALARTVQSQLAQSTRLEGRVLDLGAGANSSAIDAANAVAIGRAQNVDVVLVGAVLEASSEESSKSAGGSGFGGFHLGGAVHSIKATVTLRGDLYSTATGKQIDSIRVTGNASQTKLGSDVSTNLGELSKDEDSFNKSPIGKALHQAVADLVNRISGEQSRMTHYTGGTATGAVAPSAQVGSPAAGAAANTSSAAGAQPVLTAVKIDFIPGEKTIFFDDFHDMPPGEPPPHWTLRNGLMQLRMGGGIRELYTDGHSDVNMTSPSFGIPTDFTFQLVCVCQGKSLWEFIDKDDHDVFEVDMEGTDSHKTVRAYVTGPKSLNVGDSGDVNVVAGKPDEFDLWAQQGRVRAYLNGVRFADINNVNFGPMDHVYASDFNYRPTGIRSFRIAEAAPDPAQVLASTGKYVTHGIYFDTDSDVLKPESAGVIKEISDALYKNGDMKLEIDGYTDSTGDAAHNLDLSKRRAAAVMKVLVSQFGIDASRLTSNGFGAANPVASNDTADGRTQNRRVEFVKK